MHDAKAITIKKEEQLVNKNKDVAIWLGLCWHEWNYHSDACAKCKGKKYESQPDFIAHPLELLRLMRKRKDWGRFLDSIGGFYNAFGDEIGMNIVWKDSIEVDYILDTAGKLLEAAWQWLKQDKNENA